MAASLNADAPTTLIVEDIVKLVKFAPLNAYSPMVLKAPLGEKMIVCNDLHCPNPLLIAVIPAPIVRVLRDVHPVHV